MLYRNKLSDREATMIVLETSRSLGLEADTPLKRIHLDLATVKQKTLVDFVTKGSRNLFMMLSMPDGFLLEDLEIWSSRKDYKAAETIAKTQAFIHSFITEIYIAPLKVTTQKCFRPLHG